MVTTQAYAPPYGESISALALQSDGKIVAAGTADGWAIVRYNSDATLDASFGKDGIGHYTSGGIADMVLQTDGRIVASGLLGIYQVQIARFNPDGAPDTTFGSGGFVTLPQPNRKSIPYSRNAITLQSDGKILWLANLGGPWQLMRFLPNGSLDSTFASGGVLTFALGTNMVSAAMQQVGTEQRILVAGGLNGHVAVWRFRPNGQLDGTFGTAGTGVVSANFCTNGDYATSVRPDPSGNLLVAAAVQFGPNTASDFAMGIARFSANGILDTTFAHAGKISLGIVPQYSRDGIGPPNTAVDGSGRVIVWGSGGTYGPALLRLNIDGTVDTTFPNGRLENFPYDAGGGYEHLIVQQVDGKLLFGGTIAGSLAQFWTMRILP